MYSTDEAILDRLNEHLNAALGKNPVRDWFVIALQGSQNYGIATEHSDIDSKLLALPTLDEIVFSKKPVNNVYVMLNDEHVDVKDVRHYFQIFRKQNINFVEILFTPWYIVNAKYADLWEKLRENRETLARMNEYRAIACMVGMCREKARNLTRRHPSRTQVFDKYGYDPKELCHLARIENFIINYGAGEPYEDCLNPSIDGLKEHLIYIKENGYHSPEAAQGYADSLLRVAEMYGDMYLGTASYSANTLWVKENKDNQEMDKLLNDVLYELITRSLKEELNE